MIIANPHVHTPPQESYFFVRNDRVRKPLRRSKRGKNYSVRNERR